MKDSHSLTRSCDETRLWSRFECLIARFEVEFPLTGLLSTARNPLSLPPFLALMAWNIDYEHDSEEVIILKRHIADQGSRHRHFNLLDSRFIAVSDNRYSTLQSQLIKTKNTLDDNKATLDETTCKVGITMRCDWIVG